MKRGRATLVDSSRCGEDVAAAHKSRKPDRRGSPARSALTSFSERVDDIPLEEVLQSYSKASYVRGGRRSLIHSVHRERKDTSVAEQQQQCTAAARLVEALVQRAERGEQLSCPAAPEMSDRQQQYSAQLSGILEAPLSPTDFLGRLHKRVGATQLMQAPTGDRAARLVQSHLHFSGDGLCVKTPVRSSARGEASLSSREVGSQTVECDSGSGSGGELDANLFRRRTTGRQSLEAERAQLGLSSAPVRVHGDDLDKSASSLLMLLRGGSGKRQEQKHGVSALVSFLVQSQPEDSTKAKRKLEAGLTDGRYSSTTLSSSRRLARSVSTPGASHSGIQRSFPIKSASSRSFVVVATAPSALRHRLRAPGEPGSVSLPSSPSSPLSPRGAGRGSKSPPGRAVPWGRSLSESDALGDGRAGARSASLHQASISQFMSPAHATAPSDPPRTEAYAGPSSRVRLKQQLLVPRQRSGKHLVSTGCSTDDLLPDK